MEELFEKKLSISGPEMETTSMEVEVEADENGSKINSSSKKIVELLRIFLDVQDLRAHAYSLLEFRFQNYMASGVELDYQQFCSEITVELNDCSKQVLKIESLFVSPDYNRKDLASLLRSVEAQENEKFHITTKIQELKKAGRPSERLVSHENCRFTQSTGHECVLFQQITKASGTEDAEADAQYNNVLKESIKGVQDANVAINEYLEVVKYEIAALQGEQSSRF